jgi:large subunit ribosomal protein LP0
MPAETKSNRSKLQVLKKKEDYLDKVVALLEEYPKFLIVNCDNIGSKLMQDIRRSLRPSKSVLLMGKNTLIRKAVQSRIDDHPEWAQFLPLIKQNVGIVLTKGSLANLREKLQENMRPAIAKAGVVAPDDVFLPKQVTHLEPSKTSFFAALNIATKITRGCVEILNDIKLCEKGKKVGSSEAALLQMLDIKPFVYGAKIISCFNGSIVFPPKFIDFSENGISDETLLMALSHPAVLSFPQVIADGFRNLVAVSLGTDYEFSQSEQFKNNLNSGVITSVINSTEETLINGNDVDGSEESDSGSEVGFGDDPFNLDFF